MNIVESINSVGPLSCVYFATMSLGVIYALILLIGAEAGQVHGDLSPGGDFHVEGDFHGEGDLHGLSLSPVALAGFVTAFGAFGLITEAVLGAAAAVWLSLLIAVSGGVLVGGISQLVFYNFIVKSQGSSEVTRQDVLGATAEVLTPIPAGRVGEIAFVAQGARVVMTARGAVGQAIARGTVVWVIDQVGSVAMVMPIDTLPESELPGQLVSDLDVPLAAEVEPEPAPPAARERPDGGRSAGAGDTGAG